MTLKLDNTLESILKENPKITTCLVDLSGVVYNESGIIPGVVNAFKTLQKQKMY